MKSRLMIQIISKFRKNCWESVKLLGSTFSLQVKKSFFFYKFLRQELKKFLNLANINCITSLNIFDLLKRILHKIFSACSFSEHHLYSLLFLLFLLHSWRVFENCSIDRSILFVRISNQLYFNLDSELSHFLPIFWVD